jgi:hypothetical protein
MIRDLAFLFADPLFTALLGVMAGGSVVGLLCWKAPA